MPTVIVHLNQSWPDALMRGYVEGDELQRSAFSTIELVPPGFELDDEMICELTYRVLNAPEEILSENQRAVAQQYRAQQLRSLCVGDLIEIHRPGLPDTFYACADFGFREVPSPAGWLRYDGHGLILPHGADVARERGISARPLDERGVARLDW